MVIEWIWSVLSTSALLTCSSDNSDKVVEYLDVCKRLSIEVLPPDVNESEHAFRVRDGKIRYGLTAVKGVGQKAVESMVAAREALGRFGSVHDFVEHVDLRLCNKSVLEALARSGAFDGLGVRRAQVLSASESLISHGQRIQQERASGQMTMFGDAAAAPSQLPDVPELSTAEILALEKQTLGFYLTGHPLESVKEELAARATPISKIREMETGQEVTAGGLVTAVRRINDRRGNPMAFVTIEDLDGTIDITAFKDAFGIYKSVLQPEQVILARGKVNRAREEPTVLLDRVTLWESAPPLQVGTSLPLDGASPDRLRQLRDTITDSPGRCPVRVEILPPEGGRPVTVAALGMLSTTVSQDALARLRSVAGGGSVTVTTPGF